MRGDGTAAGIARRLRAAPPRAGATRVVAIDGRSGAGKSTLAARVAVALDGAPVVALEGLYGGWDGLDDGIARLAAEVLAPLAAAHRALVPCYDWTAGAWAAPWPLDPPPLLIVEGVGAAALPAARYESLTVWLDAPAAVRKRRALARDGDVFAPHWDRWAAQEDALLARDPIPGRAGLAIDAGEPIG
ncbi:MAG TPA: hypothetical protein VH478_12635 [Trebonia sp.]|jgi:uridine kinase|nr:hypothetical protein [Trebonia sp.]